MLKKQSDLRGRWKRIICISILLISFILGDLTAGFSKISLDGKTGPLKVEAASSEYRAFWFSFYDYTAYRKKYGGASASSFRTYFDKVCKNGKSRGMNRIIVQVRPFADAVYKSRYFPWSEYISGRQGRNPGFDPLSIMVSVAHSNGLKIEAWINPYRVAYHTSFSRLSSDNPARKWHSKKKKKRNVLVYNGGIYFNPSKKEVRDLIVNGVREIVRNYQVDGIHMDDYFYPSFSRSNVKSAFDAKEYKKSKYRRQGKSIAAYRRIMVNYLVKRVHAAVKAIRPSCTFGISPAGYMANLTSSYQYYVDINTWLNSTQYVDYICPQIYWGFKHPHAKFDRMVNQWVSKCRSGKVKLYLGIAVYKAGHNVGASSAEKKEWRSDAAVLKKMVNYGRAKGAKGFAFFDYSDLVSAKSGKAVNQLKTVLK